MHLLAASPGGFTDEEGIIDLDQTPCDVVFLSAADSQLALLSSVIQHTPPEFSIRLANWMNLSKPAAFDLYEHKVLEQSKVVIISLLGGVNYFTYGVERLLAWQKQDDSRTLIMIAGDDNDDEVLFKLNTTASTNNIEAAYLIWRYIREGGQDNINFCFNFIKQYCIDHNSFENCATPSATKTPNAFLYLPSIHSKTEQSNKELSNTGQSNISTWQQSSFNLNNQQTAIFIFYKSHVQNAHTQMFDDFINLCAKQHLNILPIAITSLKDSFSLLLINELIEQSDAKIILNATGFCSHIENNQSLFINDLPVLQLILASSDERTWQDSNIGLFGRDLAMQVVLPEMDGRIITRSLSFKQNDIYDEITQLNVIQYQLHFERATFIIELAKKWIMLGETKNQDKKLAIILANYPTKDGRIGNGVGLDTPNSVIEFLNGLKNNDYNIDNIPQDGDKLIEALLEVVTNNPNTVHYLACWQSMDLDDYKYYFKQLPSKNQQAILERWGEPETDPKCRDNRIMISGIRLGKQFIGIQPARGFNEDLSANYHDPDLVPPHNYLAFYFWLRFIYKVNAFVHVGKHGNLEWLPGKGTALSNECYPDLILGPMPNFYPFIVNDPGEGSQAKRRTQAVIIDHLMPPMTRAESYGELAQLESLVDEYYQAMGLDPRREKWLKYEILKLAKSTNLLDEVSLTGDSDSDEQESLEALDSYLCEIKDSQIRYGLHILGKLPNNDKIAHTIVALLRLPHGTQIHTQGILNNLCKDLDLKVDDEYFNPLDADTQKWVSKRPAILQNLSDKTWFHQQHTKDRLEALALHWVKEFVIQNNVLSCKDLSVIEHDFPNTFITLKFAKEQLLQWLYESQIQEIQALIHGLNNKWVAPGPSGAPTRGRLDCLPTGRNFYSIDNRNIPTPAAWQLGKLSAQALIERHLQEEGDYPNQIGISVWGTSTMRTGGDDIAQAFALMGIEPIWSEHANRVIDFKIIPTMLLNRPRVDVTLRVSGFFRDAFLGVMKLFDAAVIALMDYDEPAQSNTIKANIQQREQELLDQGLSAIDAKQQASFRVFGSKPGSYGAGLQGLIDERCWEQASDLATAYVNWGGYAYSNIHNEGVEAKQAFVDRLSKLEAVVQNQDNREHDILDSDDYYQFQGGMSNAVKTLSGKQPQVYHGDHSNPTKPKIKTLKEELNRVLRARVLNPKWIKAMQEHGYKGAFEMAATVDYLFAFDATTDFIDDYQYKKVADSLIFDKQNQAFMQKSNINALEEMSERMLEAIARGMWEKSEDYENKLQDLLADIDAKKEGFSND
ncbi:MAG: cobaltochelatase subunit CobN [Saccharospirillaceae bacterium]|nr:cobaltochelatase subunit CobN [Pseudomonadales bacterium]NRB80063.1 cobaltochelatase subunit CobN [Saccharospirillaceae bacterium]